MDNLFEILGFQDAMKQSESNMSMSDLTNDLIMNGNYSNTMDLNSDLVNIMFDEDE